MDIKEEEYQVHIKVAKLEEKIDSVYRQYEKDMEENRKQISGLFKRIEENFLERHNQLDAINTRISALEFKILSAFRIDMKKIGIALFVALGSYLTIQIAEGWFQMKMSSNTNFTFQIEEDERYGEQTTKAS